jgi:hypothetical protein
MEEKRALALQARYEMECDQFDDTFLTGERYGESFPANSVEHEMMMNNARSKQMQLRADARFWGINGAQLRKAREDLMRYSRVQIAETFERFKDSLDQDRYSQR